METGERKLNEPVQRMPIAAELRRLIKAFGYSCAGFSAAYRTQASFRADLVGCALMLPVALWLGRSWVECAWLISTLVLILFAEIINSAIEAVVDRIGLEYHELSKRAKDLGSAAVFLALVNWLVVWGGVVIDRFQLL